MSINTNSVGRAQHSEPTFTLYGRIAADFLGKFTVPKTSLHFSLVIDDAYSGITVMMVSLLTAILACAMLCGSGPISMRIACRLM